MKDEERTYPLWPLFWVILPCVGLVATILPSTQECDYYLPDMKMYAGEGPAPLLDWAVTILIVSCGPELIVALLAGAGGMAHCWEKRAGVHTSQGGMI